jgi:hypothetical protein
MLACLSNQAEEAMCASAGHLYIYEIPNAGSVTKIEMASQLGHISMPRMASLNLPKSQFK